MYICGKQGKKNESTCQEVDLQLYYQCQQDGLGCLRLKQQHQKVGKLIQHWEYFEGTMSQTEKKMTCSRQHNNVHICMHVRMYVCINCRHKIWKAYLVSSRMLSLGRGRGLSFKAGVDMLPFKVETTKAFLNLFPRSRITKSIREYINKEHTGICGYLHLTCSQPTWKQITGGLATTLLVWRIDSRPMFVRHVCFWHLILKWAVSILLVMLVSASERLSYQSICD